MAGPALHAALLARELGIARTIIPQGPGHFSAFGCWRPAAGRRGPNGGRPLDETDLDAAFARATGAATAELGEQAAGQPGCEVRRAPLSRAGAHARGGDAAETDLAGAAGRAELRSAFDRRCLEAYAFRLDVPLEVVAVRVSAVAPMPAVQWAGRRRRRCRRAGRLLPAGGPGHSWRRGAGPGDRQVRAGRRGPAAGPCVVEEQAATTLVFPARPSTATRWATW